MKKTFEDRNMQDENHRKSQEDEIRKSAENLEIPHRLKPENLDELLAEGKGRDGKRGWEQRKEETADFIFRYRKAAGAAAACLAVFLLAVYAVPGLKTGTDAGKTEAAGRKNVMENAEVFDTSGNETAAAAAEGGDTGAFLASEDYDQVYEKIYEEPQKAMEERDMWYSKGALSEGGRSTMSEEASTDTAAAADMGAAGESSGASYSDTNVRTEGVDEGDLVKTDGQYIYTLSRSGSLHITSADGSSLETAGETSLENMTDSIMEMYVDGDILCVVASGYESGLDDQGDGVYEVMSKDYTRLYTYDITDRSKITLKGIVTQDGYYESSRKSGSYVYLFSRYYTNIYEPPEKDQLQYFIPSINGARMAAEDILYPVCPQTDSSQLIISSVDLNQPEQTIQSKSLISGSGMYYVSQNHIYICMTDYSGEEFTTQIAAFAYKDGTITGKAAGEVNGQINDSFSIDEYNGYLRVVVTRYKNGWGQTESNSLYVLDEQLKAVGKIEDLAKGETIRSARFMGDIGYFVTYKQTDPLFSVNLKDPENPEILGELKITGFSEYLHFYGENKLLGIGWETDPDTGMQEGLKLSMFDISNPADVKEIDKMVLKDVEYCNAVRDYKGILIDPGENLFGMAMGSYSENYDLYGYYGVFSYDDENGFQKLLFQSLSKLTNSRDDSYSVINEMRGIYIGDTFYLCQDRGIWAFDRKNEYKMSGTLEW